MIGKIILAEDKLEEAKKVLEATGIEVLYSLKDTSGESDTVWVSEYISTDDIDHSLSEILERDRNSDLDCLGIKKVVSILNRDKKFYRNIADEMRDRDASDFYDYIKIFIDNYIDEDEYLKKIRVAIPFWEALGTDVGIDENEKLDQDLVFTNEEHPEYNIKFEKGTDIYEIWHYIEEIYDVRVVDLMGVQNG